MTAKHRNPVVQGIIGQISVPSIEQRAIRSSHRHRQIGECRKATADDTTIQYVRTWQVTNVCVPALRTTQTSNTAAAKHAVYLVHRSSPAKQLRPRKGGTDVNFGSSLHARLVCDASIRTGGPILLMCTPHISPSVTFASKACQTSPSGRRRRHRERGSLHVHTKYCVYSTVDHTRSCPVPRRRPPCAPRSVATPTTHPSDLVCT